MFVLGDQCPADLLCCRCPGQWPSALDATAIFAVHVEVGISHLQESSHLVLCRWSAML